MAEVIASESVLTPDGPDSPEEEKGVSLEDWMEARDAELMVSYTSPPVHNDRVRAKTCQGGQRNSQSRENSGSYTANLVAESVYSSPAYAGTTPASRQQRRGRSRGLPPKKIAPLNGTKPKTAPAEIFLASPLNKLFQDTKRTQSLEEKKLREEVDRQKRDIVLLRSQLKHRDALLEDLANEVIDLKEEVKKTSSFSRKSKDKESPMSPNSVRLQSLSQPRKVRPKASSDGIAKSYIDWIEYHGAEGPGVGDYDTDKSYKMQEARGGGKFNTSNSKSDLDMKIHHASQLPGPGTYKSQASNSQIKGGKISVANVKSDIDWQILRASQSPGPGEYKAKTVESSGGSFSTSKPKTELEWKIHYAKQSPGPGAYQMPEQKKSGGSFSTANPKSDLEWKIFYAQKSPGAGEYTTTAPLTPSGGKFNQSKPKSDLDWTIHNAKQSPGPGQYKISDESTRKSSHSGKFPFVYKPTDPDKLHLAKGMNAIVKMNRQKKIVMAMMNCGAVAAGSSGKKLSQMSPNEKKKWEAERDKDVQRTRAMLDRLSVIQEKRKSFVEMGEAVPDDLPSHIVPRSQPSTPQSKKMAMGSLLKKHIKTGEVEKMVDELDEKAAQEGTAPAKLRSALSLDIPSDNASPPSPASDTASTAATPAASSLVKAIPIGGYYFETHKADWVDKLSSRHLSENGLEHGNVVYCLKEPPTLMGASLLLFKLSQKVASEKITGVPHHVNYYRMFKVLDYDNSNNFSKTDFITIIRKVLGIDKTHTSDGELSSLFGEINTSGETITLGEFAAFAKGAQHSSNHHGHMATDDTVPTLHISPDLNAVHLVLWRLAVHCATEMDKNKPEDAPHTNPATVTYVKMFEALDMDKLKRISREEWAFVFRMMLGLGLTVSDFELNSIYDAIHPGGEEGVTLSEFAAYAQGARESTFARGAGFVWDLSEQQFGEEISAAFDDLLVLED